MLYNDGDKIKLNETSTKGGGYIHGYTMDDISGSIINDDIGSQNGTASNVTYSNGKIGDTGLFNGTSSYIDCGSPSDFDRTVKSANGCSYECWAKADSWGSDTVNGSKRILVDKSGWNIIIMSDAFGQITGGKSVSYVSKTGLSLNIWYHIVYNVNADYTTELYVNGISVDTSSDTIVPTNLTGGIYIGANINPDRYWDGLIDQTRFYIRPLSSYEIINLYNKGNGC